ncbi:MAG: quinone-dependent dihydroorotate dehydrogenase [bacterium]
MYEKIIRSILFRFNPESAHDFFIKIGEMLGASSLCRSAVKLLFQYRHPALRTKVLGINFENPIGLAAGFDKDMRLTQIIPSVGFGFMEVGAVTQFPYAGNTGPRLVRLPDDQAIIVHYGLKNIGAAAIKEKLKKLKFAIPVGLNIAKTNRPDIKDEKSVEDYAATYRLLSPYFSYITFNISCPNAQDGCTFQDPRFLNLLLGALAKEKKSCPVLLKISNDLTEMETDKILDVVRQYSFIDGFVIANLSKRRDLLNLKSSPDRLNVIPEGGISGKPIKNASTNLIKYIYRQTKGKCVIIGVGGVFCAEDAYEKIKAGASLVQLITGLIYRGPAIVKEINQGLVELLKKDGCSNIGEAVGKVA